MLSGPSFMQASVAVTCGGGVGAWLRFAVGYLLRGTNFPWATLLVNVAGSFAMGVLVGLLAQQNGPNEGWRLLVGVGFLGGFTTFSAFSLELVQLAQRGAFGLAGVYAALSVLGGVLGLIAGLALGRMT